MALRQIVIIDEEKCDGCGKCIPSCAEGAIQLIDGKAKLLAENLCDGLGACLGECPQGAITVEEREADEYDEVAVTEHLETLGPAAQAAHKAHQAAHAAGDHGHAHGGPPAAIAAAAGHKPAPSFSGCPGSRTMQIEPLGAAPTPGNGAQTAGTPAPAASALRQWPVQLHLVSPEAPYFQGADLLLAADCTAFSLGDFHSTHLSGKSLAVACPKLDQGQQVYIDKLVAMIDGAHIDTLTVLVMEVPCCAGLVHLARQAVEQAERKVPVKQVVVGLEGVIRSEDWL